MKKSFSIVMMSALITAILPIGPHMQVHAEDAEGDKNLANVTARFCNDPNEIVENLNMTVSPGEEKDICIELSNEGIVDVPMQLNFVDGAFTSNTNRQSCMKETDVEKFGQFVSGYDSIVTVPAGQKKQVIAKIRFGADKIGKVLGCLTYRPAVTDNKTYGGMSVIIRKARTISVFVAGNIEADLQYYLPENDEYLAKNDKMMVTSTSDKAGVNIGVGFYNSGDLEENVTVKGSMKDTFGKVVTFDETVKTIPSGKKDMVAYNIPKLAWYKMWFTVNLEVTHQPKLDGIDPQYVSDELKNPQTDNISITFFIFPWWIVIMLAVLALLTSITKMLRKRMKAAAAKKAVEQEEFKHRQHDHEHTQE